MRSFLVGVLAVALVVIAPASLIVIALLWLMQQKHEERLQTLYEGQKFVIEFPETAPPPDPDPKVLDEGLKTGKVVRLSDWKR